MQRLFGFAFKLVFKLLTKPFFLGMAMGGATAFVAIDAQRRKKVMELLGL